MCLFILASPRTSPPYRVSALLPEHLCVCVSLYNVYVRACVCVCPFRQHAKYPHTRASDASHPQCDRLQRRQRRCRRCRLLIALCLCLARARPIPQSTPTAKFEHVLAYFARIYANIYAIHVNAVNAVACLVCVPGYPLAHDGTMAQLRRRPLYSAHTHKHTGTHKHILLRSMNSRDHIRGPHRIARRRRSFNTNASCDGSCVKLLSRFAANVFDHFH